MGNLCGGSDLNEIDKELIIENDLKTKVEEDCQFEKHVKYITDVNPFQYLTTNEILDFIYSLEVAGKGRYSNNNLFDFVHKESVSIVFDRKIKSHPLVNNHFEETSIKIQTFSKFMNFFLEYSNKVGYNIHKEVFGHGFPSEFKQCLMKISLLPIAFQMSEITLKKVKLQTLFALLSENEKLSFESSIVKIFFFSAIACASTSTFKALLDLVNSETFPEIGVSEELSAAYKSNEYKDSKIVYDAIVFEMKKRSSMTYEEFEKAMVELNLMCLLNDNETRTAVSKWQSFECKNGEELAGKVFK